MKNVFSEERNVALVSQMYTGVIVHMRERKIKTILILLKKKGS